MLTITDEKDMKISPEELKALFNDLPYRLVACTGFKPVEGSIYSSYAVAVVSPFARAETAPREALILVTPVIKDDDGKIDTPGNLVYRGTPIIDDPTSKGPYSCVWEIVYSKNREGCDFPLNELEMILTEVTKICTAMVDHKAKDAGIEGSFWAAFNEKYISLDAVYMKTRDGFVPANVFPAYQLIKDMARSILPEKEGV